MITDANFSVSQVRKLPSDQSISRTTTEKPTSTTDKIVPCEISKTSTEESEEKTTTTTTRSTSRLTTPRSTTSRSTTSKIVFPTFSRSRRQVKFPNQLGNKRCIGDLLCGSFRRDPIIGAADPVVGAAQELADR